MAFLLAKTADEFPYVDDEGELLPVNFKLNDRLTDGRMLDLDAMVITPKPIGRQRVTRYDLRGSDELKKTRRYVNIESTDSSDVNNEDDGDY